MHDPTLAGTTTLGFRTVLAMKVVVSVAIGVIAVLQLLGALWLYGRRAATDRDALPSTGYGAWAPRVGPSAMGTKRSIVCMIRGHRWDVVSGDEGLHERCARCGKHRAGARTDEAEVMIRGMRNGGGGVGI